MTHDRHGVPSLHLDEFGTRHEIARVTDVCGSCRRCTDLCGSFDVMFAALDARGAGDLFVPAEQDRMVLACVQCNRCLEACPHLEGPGAVHVPATMGRGRRMLAASGRLGLRERLKGLVLGLSRYR